MKIETLAAIVHEANAEYCRSIGDNSQHRWADAPKNIQASAIDGILAILKNPDAPASASHDNWLAFKADDGWVYGETKDLVKKTHHCMVPYDELPAEQQLKDAIYHAIVHAVIDEIEYDEKPDGTREINSDALQTEAII